jgi:SAM-dependent methyltransferase
MTVGFESVARSLRRQVIAREVTGTALTAAQLKTVETNSGYTVRRGELIVGLLRDHVGIGSLQGLRVVDVGSGYGALALYLAASGALVTAVEPNEDRIAVGKFVGAEYELPVTFVRGWMQRLPLDDATFDVVLLNNSFCYVVPPEDRRRALREALRTLRPGGWLTLRDPNRWAPRDPFSGLPLIHFLPPKPAAAVATRLGHRRSHVRLVSPPHLRSELTAAGFERVAHVPVGGRSLRRLAVARYQHCVARRPASGSTGR